MQECVEIVEGASTGAVVHDTNLPIFIGLSISARRILSEHAYGRRRIARKNRRRFSAPKVSAGAHKLQDRTIFPLEIRPQFVPATIAPLPRSHRRR